MSIGPVNHREAAAFPPSLDAPTSVGETRRRDLIAAAFDVLKEGGFEGLRTRDVAERAAVNNATLYYYFPTKEELIQGVAEHLAHHLEALLVPTGQGAGTARDELAQYTGNVVRAVHDVPDVFRVMIELHLRAERDPQVHAILAAADARWQSYLRGLLERGCRQGVFRADLHPEETAHAMMAFFKGMTFQLNAHLIDDRRILTIMERWLLPVC